MPKEHTSPQTDKAQSERPSYARRPIGVFDSGVGGLSVVRALSQKLPYESLFYVADRAHCPYGARSAQEIRRLSESICRYLMEHDAKLIVVACNTASAAALSHLRRLFPQLPFVGMVPAVKPAAQSTKTGVVGVLATQSTFQGQLYRDVVRRYAQGTRVIAQICDGLVECVEKGALEEPRTKALLRSYINPLLGAGADTLVMGCTHYAFLVPTIRQLIGDDVQVLETGEAIARRTTQILKREGGVKETGRGKISLATTGDPLRFQRTAKMLLGKATLPHKLHWVEGQIQNDTD
jgi:glutamate racemase